MFMIRQTIQPTDWYYMYNKGEISEEYIWSIDVVKIVWILMCFFLLLLLYCIFNNKNILYNNNINNTLKLGIWISILVIIQIFILIIWIEVYIKNDIFNIEILDHIFNIGIIIEIIQCMLKWGMYLCINIIFKKVGIFVIWNEIGQNMLKRINIFFENVCYNWAVFLSKPGVYKVKKYGYWWMKIWILCRWSELFIKLFLIILLLILLLLLIVVLIMESSCLVLVLVIPLVWMCVKLLRLIIYKIKEEWKCSKNKDKEKDKHKDIILYNNKMIFGHNIKNIKRIGNKTIYIEIQGNNHNNIKRIGKNHIYIEIQGNNHNNIKRIGNNDINIEILGNKRNYSTSNKDLNNDKDGGLICMKSMEDKECMSKNPINIDPKEIVKFNSWVAGVIEAEGSWYVGILIDLESKHYVRIYVGLDVTMHIGEKATLEKCKKALNEIGKIRTRENKNAVVFEVKNFNDIKNTVIPYLEKNNDCSPRKHTFNAFREVVELMSTKEHLKAEGIAKIIRIVYGCHWITSNRFYTQEELLSVIGNYERAKELKEYKKQYEKEKKGVLNKELRSIEKNEAALSLPLNDAIKLRRYGIVPKDIIIYSNEHIKEILLRDNNEYLKEPASEKLKSWVAGAIEGDGSWPIIIWIDLKNPLFVSVKCVFKLTQHYMCVDMLKLCQHAISGSASISNDKADNLKSKNNTEVANETTSPLKQVEIRKIGRIEKKQKCGNGLDYRVDSQQDIWNVVIPYLKHYNENSARENSFNAYYMVCKLISEKQHQNPEGLAQIIDIVYDNPGNGPVRPYTRDELKSAIGNKEIAKKLYENNIRKKAEKKKQGIEEEEEEQE